MPVDKIFTSDEANSAPFSFNASVAAVFDDMLYRSVPLYSETLGLQMTLAKRFYRPGTRMYDLGCSHGNFGIGFLEAAGDMDFSMIALDNSEPMLEIYKKRLSVRKGRERIRLCCEDICESRLENASVVVMNLTLQFLPLPMRKGLVCRIYDALVPGGILLLTEKVVHENTFLTDMQQELYYEFKAANGYSSLEISRKREALENVLVPETMEAHQKRLAMAGFRKVEIYLKWFHFTSFLAVKEDKVCGV
ncbi:carboxy-S-adenosyl-L-methionine synthase CmoA [Desulfobotulus sp. H1]|uniref:Carboxy-S-adenosyl-L-methionine synthase n=1 Tax=Desulfobotulus pelophilus TaxID=2823377 RepID=A0ABT3NBA9_9BACT|nr:carboxy-S-adenosyl-L-methionine synthase CmoA [Desulfobotulus pelophilus]MCW7754710.1 carboxy-S-adenosyl-L-methionine synthase CmoA [Desulfobotulus pelophilus]